jgi:O-methyltransferase
MAFNKIMVWMKASILNVFRGDRSTRIQKKLPKDFENIHVRIFRAVERYTMTSPERVYSLIEAVKYIERNQIPGAMVECGVWKGGSTMAMALTLKELNSVGRDLFLYDTFSGMDISFKGESAKEIFNDLKVSDDSSEWCFSSIDEVRSNVMSTGYPEDKLHFIAGKVEDTIPGVMPEQISLLRLDTDWYESTKHELTHLYPRLSTRGVIIIDDYGYWLGARKAVDEYIAEHKLNILLNRIDRTGRIAIKL